MVSELVSPSPVANAALLPRSRCTCVMVAPGVNMCSFSLSANKRSSSKPWSTAKAEMFADLDSGVYTADSLCWYACWNAVWYLMVRKEQIKACAVIFFWGGGLRCTVAYIRAVFKQVSR